MDSGKQNRIFQRMLRKYGAHELARKIAKLPSYRAYAQKYPYDGAERPFSLDFEYEQDSAMVRIVDLLPSSSTTQEPAQIDREIVAEFKATLSPRQIELVELLEQGYKPKDAAKLMGYKNTGGVRYLKWAIRRKYEAFKASQSL